MDITIRLRRTRFQNHWSWLLECGIAIYRVKRSGPMERRRPQSMCVCVSTCVHVCFRYTMDIIGIDALIRKVVFGVDGATLLVAMSRERVWHLARWTLCENSPLACMKISRMPRCFMVSRTITSPFALPFDLISSRALYVTYPPERERTWENGIIYQY